MAGSSAPSTLPSDTPHHHRPRRNGSRKQERRLSVSPSPASQEGGHVLDEADADSLEAYRAALPPLGPTPAVTCERLALAVQHRAGQLAETLQWKGEVTGPLDSADDKAAVESAAGALAAALLRLAQFLHIDLGQAAVEKMALNARKYPAALARARAGKYTAYSDVTGITKTEGQTTEGGGRVRRPPWCRDVGVRGLQRRLRVFAAEREWDKYHTPRNIVLALLGETGELAEIVLDLPAAAASTGSAAACPARWPLARRDALAQELADCTIYLCRFSDVCGIDLGAGIRAAAQAEWARHGSGEGAAMVGMGPGVGPIKGMIGLPAALTVAGGLALLGLVGLGKMLRPN